MCCGSMEYGLCEVCGEEAPLRRTYFHYNIKCECHSPNHFEMVRHCETCEPVEPTETKVIIATKNFAAGSCNNPSIFKVPKNCNSCIPEEITRLKL